MNTQKNPRGRIGTAITLLLTVGALALLVPATSSAQSSSVDGYGGVGGEVQASLTDAATTSEGSENLGSLPFTGLDIGYMILGGVLLLIAGLAIGRVASRTPRTH